MGGGRAPIGWFEAFDRAPDSAAALSEAGAEPLVVEPSTSTVRQGLVSHLFFDDVVMIDAVQQEHHETGRKLIVAVRFRVIEVRLC